MIFNIFNKNKYNFNESDKYLKIYKDFQKIILDKMNYYVDENLVYDKYYEELTLFNHNDVIF